MLLTEQEIDALRKSLPAVCKHQDVIRAAESAVLEKLKAQEPVAVADGTFNHNCDLGVSLYTNPLPPDDVVRDAARYKWLREHVGVFNDGYYHPWMPVGNSKIECADKLETDRAIDAAMKEMK